MSTISKTFRPVTTGFPGLLRLRPRVFEDRRGIFVKTFHAGRFRDLGIPFDPREEFYSISAKNVLRGMHFQRPPAAHAKLVYCLSGSALDVVVDLRRDSPKFGRAFSCHLDATARELLFIPAGFAHGFLALKNGTLMVYQTDAEHAPDCDAGIAWDSFGFKWPVAAPVLSDRDRQFPALADFQTPF